MRSFFDRLVKSFFYGNYFYGLCAVALIMEATVQQQYPLNPIYFYLGIFSATTWFYTLTYKKQPDVFRNPRGQWYLQNASWVKWSQRLLMLLCLITLFQFLSASGSGVINMSFKQWILVFIFPLIALLYYGFNLEHPGRAGLRNIGWMKPFVIGFTWAGFVTIFPILFYNLSKNEPYQFTLVGCLLSLKNFMFIAMLCIMFDVKDFATDYNQQLKTYVVSNGLRKTIFRVLIPLSLAGLGSFILYGLTRNFSVVKIALNTVPFLLIAWAAYSLRKRQSILYYFTLIDGLMLVKALCGTVAMIYF
jgi:hypothetical protein